VFNLDGGNVFDCFTLLLKTVTFNESLSECEGLLKVTKENIMPGMVIAMILVGAILVKDSNRKLDEKCAQEVLDGIAESHQECRKYYTSK